MVCSVRLAATLETSSFGDGDEVAEMPEIQRFALCLKSTESQRFQSIFQMLRARLSWG